MDGENEFFSEDHMSSLVINELNDHLFAQIYICKWIFIVRVHAQGF